MGSSNMEFIPSFIQADRIKKVGATTPGKEASGMGNIQIAIICALW